MMNLSSANTSSEALPHNKELYSENSTAAPSMMMDFEAPPPVQPPLLALHEPPPNGGLAAWLQVVGGFFCFFNTWGLVNTFGAFQTYYSSELLTHETESNISWIGSIQAFLLLASTLVMGPLCDLGYTKVQLIICSVVSVFGMMMTSLCTEYWQFMLAQGVVVGVGFGGIFIPAVAIPSTYFTTKRAFALGICAAGSSVGGVIYPIIFHELQPRIGFQWTTRVMAFIMLVTLVFAICCLKVRVLATTKRSFLDLPAFVKYPKFTLYNVACLAGFMGLYVPFFYIQQYAVDIAGTNSNLAFYMLPILNAASIFGRIGPGFVADKVGVINTMLVCAFLSGLLAFCWIAIHTTAGLIVFCILYGFCSGTFVSLQGATVAHLVPHMGWMGTWMGMCAFISGIALLVGTPVAGVILGSGWLGLQCFTGGCIAFSTICISATYLMKHSPLDDTKGM